MSSTKILFAIQVISYIRGPLLFVFNFHPTNAYERYSVGVEEAGEYQVSSSLIPCPLLYLMARIWCPFGSKFHKS